MPGAKALRHRRRYTRARQPGRRPAQSGQRFIRRLPMLFGNRSHASRSRPQLIIGILSLSI
jgi:hypothetical protein